MRIVVLWSGLVLLFVGIVLWALGLWVGDSRMSFLAVDSQNLLVQHDWLMATGGLILLNLAWTARFGRGIACKEE